MGAPGGAAGSLGLFAPGVAPQAMIEAIGYHVRTPMNAILGSLDVLMGEGVTPQQRQLAQTAYGSAEALLRLLNDALDLARIEAGLIGFSSGTVSVQRVLDQVVLSRNKAAAVLGNVVSWEMLDTVPAALIGDESRLVQALGSLLDCAIEVVREGQVTLEADFEPLDPGAVGTVGSIESGQSSQAFPPPESFRPAPSLESPDASGAGPGSGRLRVSVSFSGRGVQVDWPQALLEPFVVTTLPDSVRQSGSGLSLVVARRLIEAMGGQMVASRTIEGAPMLGIEIPLARSSATGREDPVLDEGAVPAPRAHARVLVVDDNEVSNYVTRLMLEQFGLDVVTVASGEAAVEESSGQVFDLILMDCVMPGMDGYAATREIRNIQRRTRRVLPLPIIALTAQARADDERACLDAGMSDFLAKPVRLQALREALAKHLGPALSAKPGGAIG